ncbi:anti-sigma regulatory factor (Ser/Thr protein kinase) [Anoxybacillus vitaminiphilus]|uniref:Anti-sigma regulatory factor (Ser/Thr protein kinase) n=1 Tax=Paranoxybacillus vitaminiphilus TaxID=581036 RepID=A0A327YFZ4_9BACL|nr:ATP-binding protein [Anoxybacillus vitaminiphilus]RAK19142.1 anti-sigma regulatory factor (Ser/Thr protein kinase) [Anoxybacillus vitaminiphilus]
MMYELTITFPAKIESIEFCDQICEQTFSFFALEMKNELKLAVHEAVINSVQATCSKYTDIENMPIKLMIRIYENDRIEVFVYDHAGGIPDDVLAQLLEKKFEEVLWEESGRGLLLIQTLMDKVSFERIDEQIFLLKFTKKFSN